jgi:hypothetical protein
MSDASPLPPDAIGVRRLVGDGPMHVPEACVSGGLKEQVHDNVVVVTDAVRRQIVCGDEGTKILLRSGASVEGLGSHADHVDELREGGVGIGRRD